MYTHSFSLQSQHKNIPRGVTGDMAYPTLEIFHDQPMFIRALYFIVRIVSNILNKIKSV